METRLRNIASLCVWHEYGKYMIEWCDGDGNFYVLEESSDLNLECIDLFDFIFSNYPATPAFSHGCSWPLCMEKGNCPI